jgi:hypothetical protein
MKRKYPLIAFIPHLRAKARGLHQSQWLSVQIDNPGSSQSCLTPLNDLKNNTQVFIHLR